MTETLDYADYVARPVTDGDRAPAAGLGERALRTLYDGPLLPYALLRHRLLLRRCRHTDRHTYTAFLRSPAQLRLLAGPVIDFLRPGGAGDDRLDIVLVACSNGAEAYTIASWLHRHRPELDFRIRASDLHPEMVARARAARYSAAEVLHGPFMTRAFLSDTFIEQGAEFVVRPEIRARVEVEQADLLDAERLRARFGPAPLVVAQNVLFHLPEPAAERAFAALTVLLAPRAALMVAGMNLDLRARLTAEAGLAPFAQDVRRIHQEGRAHTPPHWWRVPWGAEPYLPLRRDPVRRYATVYRAPLHDAETPTRGDAGI
ncbi:hypothetical protein DLJ49_10015 [Rhodovulum sp. 12E13]|uniref:CheR family methyltransferase n=1 Tax=Rhodovulum sp. 12E13 TaxID=2203891 RepID=UPI000E18BB5A|nr:CheR family methyltransferase [Rhodovulum sp. 12E13]RDC72553.1 hypothetical protein DLJ49_10015 [Rhodovulum sp. 12E13]